MKRAPSIISRPFKKLGALNASNNFPTNVNFCFLTSVYSGSNSLAFFASAFARAISIASILTRLAAIPLTTPPSWFIASTCFVCIPIVAFSCFFASLAAAIPVVETNL